MTHHTRAGTSGRPVERRRKWFFLLLAGTALAAVAWMLAGRWRRASFEWDRFVSAFLDLSLPWLTLSLGLALVSYFGRAIRWGVMLGPLKPHPNLWGLFKSTAIGFTAVVLLGRPGEIVRPYLISLREQVSFPSQVAAWLLERICDLLAVLLLFGFALAQLGSSHALLGPHWRWLLETGGYVATAVGVLCVIALALLNRCPDAVRRWAGSVLRLLLPSRWHLRLDGMLCAFIEGLGAARGHGSMSLLILYTALEWTVNVFCLWCLFRASPATQELGLRDLLIFLGFIAFGGIAQIPGIGGGMQIVAIVVLTELFGLRIEDAAGMALLIWVFTFVVIVPIGLALGLHEGMNWRRLKELRQKAAQARSQDGGLPS